MPAHKGLIVTQYIKMWPRRAFDIKQGKSFHPEIKRLLSQPGVYILYREDEPYYVGKASRQLFRRLRSHASNPKDKYYNFWNFFSAFVVPNQKHIPEVEGILIASMPTDNSSVMRIDKISLPQEVADLLRNERMIQIKHRTK